MGVDDAVSRVDRVAGEGISWGVRRHHARRLERVGSVVLGAPAGGWADDAPPPRHGNELEVLVDGEFALARMVEEIRAASSHVHLTGWFISPGFVLVAGDPPVVVRDLLVGAAARVEVRVLLWAGAPLPVFTPSRRLVRGVRDEFRAAGVVQCALDSRERPLHCHHEKSIVIDDRVAFVGGIDMTSLAGDRRDSSRHPARAALGWHDATTRIRVRWWQTWPNTSTCAGRRLRASDWRRPSLPNPPARWPPSSLERARKASIRRCRGERSACSSPTCARFARPRA